MSEPQQRVYLGYSDRTPGKSEWIKRITPLWVKFPCVLCGEQTWIGPTQAADKAKLGGDVSCMLCAVRGGVKPEDLTGLHDRLGQPYDADTKRN